MKTQPIEPARIGFGALGQPFSANFEDAYHPKAGAMVQAEQVFLAGNGLPRRWAGQDSFVILEAGFGLGVNFLATWLAWRKDPQRCARLHYLAVDLHPPTQTDLQQSLRASLGNEAREAQGLAEELVASWPPLTCDLHRLVFETGAVQLLLAFGDAATWLRGLRAQVNAFYLDGFAPTRNPAMWSGALFRALPRLAAPGATASTWSAAREVREGLAAQGFEAQRAPGLAQKREMTVAHYRPDPRQKPFEPQRSASLRVPASRLAAGAGFGAVVVGAGIAGACVAASLAEQGLKVLVLEAGSQAAIGASGNPAGLFRSVINGHDGLHARWHRAAALHAWRQYAPLIRCGTVAGGLHGVLRMDEDLPAMQRLVAALGLPENHVRSVGARAHAKAEVEAAGSVNRPQSQSDLHPAWHFLQAGWVAPAELVRHYLSHPNIELRLGCAVHALQAPAQTHGPWQLLSAEGTALAQAPVVVLAAAQSCASLLPQLRWPLSITRGQITRLAANTPGLVAPQKPIANSGYALTLPNGDVLCGSTSHPDDPEPGLRQEDHAHNLHVLARLARSPLFGPLPSAAKELSIETLGPACLSGRVAWRSGMPDRLPLVGAVPKALDAAQASSPARLLTQARHWPRESGLYVLAGLGSRGLSSAPLAAQVLAAQILNLPYPVDQSLLDAVDPARHLVRALRKA